MHSTLVATLECLEIRLVAWEFVVERLAEAGAPESFVEYFDLTLEHAKGGVRAVPKPAQGWTFRIEAPV